MSNVLWQLSEETAAVCLHHALVKCSFGTEVELLCATQKGFRVLVVGSPWQSRRAAAISEGLRMSVRLILDLCKIVC